MYIDFSTLFYEIRVVGLFNRPSAIPAAAYPVKSGTTENLRFFKWRGDARTSMYQITSDYSCGIVTEFGYAINLSISVITFESVASNINLHLYLPVPLHTLFALCEKFPNIHGEQYDCLVRICDL